MNIIDLLNVRKAKLLEKSGDIRKKLSEIVDESSFVELNAYSFYKNEFFGEDEDGLGVMVHGCRVVEVGGRDTALLCWLAEDDLRHFH